MPVLFFGIGFRARMRESVFVFLETESPRLRRLCADGAVEPCAPLAGLAADRGAPLCGWRLGAHTAVHAHLRLRAFPDALTAHCVRLLSASGEIRAPGVIVTEGYTSAAPAARS